MKKLVVLAVALAVIGCGLAYAADAPAAKAAAPAVKAAAPAAKEECLVGKIEVKDKVATLAVSEGAMKGKMLKIEGAKAAEAEKLAGKVVEAKGVVKGNALELASVAEKKAPAAPAPKKK